METHLENMDKPTEDNINDKLDIKLKQFTEKEIVLLKKLYVEKLQALTKFHKNYIKQEN